MNNDNENIDDLFRDSIDPLKIEPTDQVWSGIDAALAKKKKRRIFGWWLFSLLVILMPVTYGIFTYVNNGSVTANNKIALPSNENISAEKIRQVENRETGNATEGEVALSRKNAYGTSIENAGLDNTFNSNEKSYKTNSETKREKNAAMQSNLTSNLHPVGNNVLASVGDVKSEIDIASGTADVLGNRTGKKMQGEQLLKAIEAKQRTKNIDANVMPGTVLLQTANANENTLTVSDTVYETQSLLENNSIVNTADSIVVKDSAVANKVVAAIPLTDDVPKNKRWTVSVFYAPDYAMRRLKQNNNYVGEDDKTQSSYYNGEKPSYSFSTGLKVGYCLGNKWSIRTGGVYGTYTQHSTFDNIFVQSDSVYQVEHNWHGDPHNSNNWSNGNNGHNGNTGNNGHNGNNGNNGNNGSNGNNGNNNGHTWNNDIHYTVQTSCGTITLDDLETDTGSAVPQNGDTLHIFGKNSVKVESVYFPLTLRYSMDKGKYHYYVEGGAALNMMLKNKVNVELSTGQNGTSEVDGIKKMNYGLLLNMGIEREIRERWSIFIEPSLRYSITPINENNPVKVYPYYFGIEAGTTFKF